MIDAFPTDEEFIIARHVHRLLPERAGVKEGLIMTDNPGNLRQMVEQSGACPPIRVAVADAAHGVVLETLRDAHERGLVVPLLVGDPAAIAAACEEVGWKRCGEWIVPAADDPAAAAKAVELVRMGEADTVMKGNIHTDTFMRALLDKERGLRVPRRRVGPALRPWRRRRSCITARRGCRLERTRRNRVFIARRNPSTPAVRCRDE